MKIGILSVNIHTKGLNFACPVHTYAFQQFLLQNHIDSVVLDYKANYYKDFEARHPADYYARLYEYQLQREPETEEEARINEERMARNKKKLEGYTALYKEREVRYDKFQKFIETYYIKTDRSYDPSLLEVEDPGCDCYICATDVVWKNNPELGFDRAYFLASTCMEDKWKISYAASRGSFKPYSEQEKELFFHYISDIDYISVREESLKEYIEDNSDRKAKVVIDPTLFHDAEFYSKITVKPEEEHYILFYYAEECTENTMQQALRCARETGLKIVELTNLPIKDGVLKDYTDVESVFRYDVGPDEWIGYIQHADYVFTNSFHASCFSIIFRKKFFVGSRKGDKLGHFLGLLGLSGRMLPSAKEKGPESLSKDIDYEAVEKILSEKREDSINFLLSSIQACEQAQRTPRDYDSYKRALTYPLRYNSRLKEKDFTWKWTDEDGAVRKMKSGTYEYLPADPMVTNNGTACLQENRFELEGSRFVGWKLCVRIDDQSFWYLESGKFKKKAEYNKKADGPVRLFQSGETVPYFPVNQIDTVVAYANWEKEEQPEQPKKQKKLGKKLLGFIFS